MAARLDGGGGSALGAAAVRTRCCATASSRRARAGLGMLAVAACIVSIAHTTVQAPVAVPNVITATSAPSLEAEPQRLPAGPMAGTDSEENRITVASSQPASVKALTAPPPHLDDLAKRTARALPPQFRRKVAGAAAASRPAAATPQPQASSSATSEATATVLPPPAAVVCDAVSLIVPSRLRTLSIGVYLNTAYHYETMQALLVGLDKLASLAAQQFALLPAGRTLAASPLGVSHGLRQKKVAQKVKSTKEDTLPWRVFFWTDRKYPMAAVRRRSSDMLGPGRLYRSWAALPGASAVNFTVPNHLNTAALPALDVMFVVTLYPGQRDYSIDNAADAAYVAYRRRGVPIIAMSHRATKATSQFAIRRRRGEGADGLARPAVRVLHISPLAATSALPFILPIHLFRKPAPPPSLLSPRRWRFLVQGSFEPHRRNYAALAALLAHPDVRRVAAKFEILLVGSGASPPRELVSLARHRGISVGIKRNLPEPYYHSACRSAHFIMTLTNPREHPQLFRDTFSSSVQVGIAYELGFVLHEAQARLHDLPPEVAFSYRSQHFPARRAHATASSALTPSWAAATPAGGLGVVVSSHASVLSSPRPQDDVDGIAHAMSAVAHRASIRNHKHRSASNGERQGSEPAAPASGNFSQRAVGHGNSHPSFVQAFLAAVSTTPDQYRRMRAAYKLYKADVDAHNGRVLIATIVDAVAATEPPGPALRGGSVPRPSPCR